MRLEQVVAALGCHFVADPQCGRKCLDVDRIDLRGQPPMTNPPAPQLSAAASTGVMSQFLMRGSTISIAGST
jgi:hypothetical protein